MIFIVTGTTDVVETDAVADFPELEYEQEQNHFISIILRKRTDANVPKSGPQEKLAKRHRRLLETIVAKQTISKEDLAAQFNISLTTLKRDLRCLRQSYIITWMGWTQNSHWEIKELDKNF